MINILVMSDRMHSIERPFGSSAPREDGNLGKISRRCALAFAFIYAVLSYGLYTDEDKFLSAIEDRDARVGAAVSDIDRWKNKPFYLQAYFLGSYLGALSHDNRE